MTLAVPLPVPRRVPRGVIGTAISGNVLIGLGAFWLSFTSLADLAARAGLPAQQAWVWPLIVDGLIVVASVSVMALSADGWRATWFPWLLLIAGAVVSVLGNGVHAALLGDPTMPVTVRVAIAAVPPLVLLASTHLTVQLIRRSRRTPQPTFTEAPETANADDEATIEANARAEATQLRDLLGWSNRRIAHALQVHPSTVGRWLPARPMTVPAATRPVDTEPGGGPLA